MTFYDNNTSVTWDSGSSLGTLLHMSTTAKSGADAFLIIVSTGSLDDNDTVTDGTNSFDVDGTPDSAKATAKIDGIWTSADTSPVILDGWDTESDNDIHIYTTSIARHTGKASGNRYRLEISTDYAHGIKNYEHYVTIEGIDFKVTNTNGIVGCVLVNNTDGDVSISHCLLHDGLSTNHTVDGIRVDSLAGGNLDIFNNIIHDFDGDGIRNGAWNASLTVNVRANTVYGCNEGIHEGAGCTFTIENNISDSCSTADYGGTFDTHNNNLSSDTTSPDISYRSKDPNYVNETGPPRDLHLDPSDTDAKDSGADLSVYFTDDIDGETRSGTWDIGADEIISAAVTRWIMFIGPL